MIEYIYTNCVLGLHIMLTSQRPTQHPHKTPTGIAREFVCESIIEIQKHVALTPGEVR